MLDGTLTLNDVDSGGNLTGATVTIGSGFIASADTLNFTTQNGISGSYDAVHRRADPDRHRDAAQYQAALDPSPTATATTIRPAAVPTPPGPSAGRSPTAPHR